MLQTGEIGAAAADVQFYRFSRRFEKPHALADGFDVVAVAEGAEVEQVGFAFGEAVRRDGGDFAEVGTDVNGFCGYVGIGGAGAGKVAVGDGDQAVGAGVGAVGAAGEGQAARREFFDEGQNGGEGFGPYVLYVGNQFEAQPRFVLPQQDVAAHQRVGGIDDVLRIRRAVLQPAFEIFDEGAVAFQAGGGNVFAVAVFGQQHDFQTAFRCGGVFGAAEGFVVVAEIAGNQQNVVLFGQPFGQIAETVEVGFVRQRAERGDDGDVHGAGGRLKRGGIVRAAVLSAKCVREAV